MGKSEETHLALHRARKFRKTFLMLSSIRCAAWLPGKAFLSNLGIQHPHAKDVLKALGDGTYPPLLQGFNYQADISRRVHSTSPIHSPSPGLRLHQASVDCRQLNSSTSAPRKDPHVETAVLAHDLMFLTVYQTILPVANQLFHCGWQAAA